MNILELSAAKLRQAAQIKEKKMEAAQAELASVLGGDFTGNGVLAPAETAAPRGKKLHWTQTPAGKARMARLMRASWSKRKA
jgi:hypothetical protein